MNSYKPHSKILAVVLSILFPGAGHFYIGHIKKSLIILPLMFFTQYIFLYIFTYYVNTILALLALSLIVAIYAYNIYNPLQIINQQKDIYGKYNHWAITLVFFMPIMYSIVFFIKDILPIKNFSIPATSMEDTILKGDMIVAQKTNATLRGELSIFKYPNHPSVFYIKRCVATSDDEVIYIDKQLLIHFHEGDKYIQKYYSNEDIISIDNKLWVVNPYIKNNTGIKYKPIHDNSAFEFLILLNSHKQIGMTPRMYTQLNSTKFTVDNQTFNAFYIKLKDDQFFMIGDNRDNSNDSRFWGVVDKDLIYGKPNVVYFHFNEDWTINWNRIGLKLDNTRNIN